MILGLLAGAAAVVVYTATAAAPAKLCGGNDLIAIGFDGSRPGKAGFAVASTEIPAYPGMLAASGALAASIRFSHARDIRTGQPIPRPIRRALAPYFPGRTLDRVRWAIAGPRLSLGTLWAKWGGANSAMTLENVIVFTSRRASKSVGLWAHELTHVRQYEVLGVDEFARCYASDASVLEEHARWNARRIENDRKHGPRYRPPVRA